MLKEQRQTILLNAIAESRTLTVREVAALLDTSEATARRDIKELAGEGLVNYVYGGVTALTDRQNKIVPLQMRDPENSKIKDAIAKRAAEMIHDGASIVIDGSSTARRIIKYIGHLKNIRIITNNTRVLREINEYNPDAEVYCCGGKYSASNRVIVGSFAENYFRSIMADFLFFSSQAITDDGYITDVSEEETSLRRVMLDHAKTKVFLCDSSKFGVRKLFTLCNISDVDIVISDKLHEFTSEDSANKIITI